MSRKIGSVVASITDLVNELGLEKVSVSGDPGTSHPAKAEAGKGNTQPATEGARSAENNKDNKEEVTGQSYQFVLTNEELARTVDTTDEWIVSRSGIRERRIAREDQATSDLGAEAARRALANAGVQPEEIDLVWMNMTSLDLKANKPISGDALSSVTSRDVRRDEFAD